MLFLVNMVGVDDILQDLAFVGEVDMAQQLQTLGHRIYSDFFLPDRISEFRRLLETALDNAYEVHSLDSMRVQMASGNFAKDKKYLVLRHDIDTDVRTARSMWDIEAKLGVKASHYFRLSTVDVTLMREIHHSGCEASYHYEEIATYCKRYRIYMQSAVVQHLDKIKELFQRNLLGLREKTGLDMKTVASHGDWINRKINLPNTFLLQDSQLRELLGIELEAYDEQFTQHITSRHSDNLYPNFWKPTSPIDAVANGEHFVYVLTHPRHWKSSPVINFADNFFRIKEELEYRIS